MILPQYFAAKALIPFVWTCNSCALQGRPRKKRWWIFKNYTKESAPTPLGPFQKKTAGFWSRKCTDWRSRWRPAMFDFPPRNVLKRNSLCFPPMSHGIQGEMDENLLLWWIKFQKLPRQGWDSFRSEPASGLQKHEIGLHRFGRSNVVKQFCWGTSHAIIPFFFCPKSPWTKSSYTWRGVGCKERTGNLEIIFWDVWFEHVWQ